MAALAIAGGALTVCNNKTEEKETVEITQQDIDNYYDALSNAQQGYLNAQKQKKTDSLNYVKNPSCENNNKYQRSLYNEIAQSINLYKARDIETPEYRAKTRKNFEEIKQNLEIQDSLIKENVKILSSIVYRSDFNPTYNFEF